MSYFYKPEIIERIKNGPELKYYREKLTALARPFKRKSAFLNHYPLEYMLAVELGVLADLKDWSEGESKGFPRNNTDFEYIEESTRKNNSNKMKKVIKLSERDIKNIVKKVILEQDSVSDQFKLEPQEFQEIKLKVESSKNKFDLNDTEKFKKVNSFLETYNRDANNILKSLISRGGEASVKNLIDILATIEAVYLSQEY